MIIIYGISGNPPSGLGGHMGIVQYFSRMLKKSGEVWILPVYHHSFKSKNTSLIEFDHRLQMCKLAFEQTGENVCVKDLEKIMSLEIFQEAAKKGQSLDNIRIGTMDMSLFLSRAYPDMRFSFILGSDTFNDVRAGKWKNSDELLKTMSFEVVSRPGIENCVHSARDGESITFHDIGGLKSISSTLLRYAFTKSYADGNQTWEHFQNCVKRELGVSESYDGVDTSSGFAEAREGLSIFVQEDVLRYIFRNRFYAA